MRHEVATRPTYQTATLPAENRALLEQYLANPQEALLSELIQRLAPMVYGVCQRQLGSGADADDAFQACFLVVVRRLKDLATKNNLAGWVHGIAFRVARKARQTRYQHTHRLHVLATMPKSNNSTDADKDLKEIIDSEIARLPAPYREAVALCELQEKTLDEAAKELGWPVGTVAGRLSRARAMLKTRLAKHGFTAIAVAAFLQTAVSASPSEALLERTLQSALLQSQNLATGALVTPHVASLARGVEASIFSSKVILLSVIMSIGLLAGGWFLAATFMMPGRDVRLVMAGNTGFAVDAYKRMRTKQPDSNLLFSPFSLSASICLLALGTDGNTEYEILQALHLPARESAHSGMSGLTRQLISSNPQLKIVNALFCEPEVPWQTRFLSESQSRYDAPLIPVKYTNPQATAQTINHWAQLNTNGIMNQLVHADIVNPRTCIACVNALSLEGKWNNPFATSQTTLGTFHSVQGDVPALMMRASTTDGIHCADTPLAHVVTLGYQSETPSNDISMTLVIPKQLNGLADIEKLISIEQMDTWSALANQPSQTATIALPKFSFCTTTRWRGPLEAMGMQSCFVLQYAHFTRMLSNERKLQLNHKNQRTKLEFSESGCRAASIGVDENVISDSIQPAVASARPSVLKENIIADRPFFFFIRHHSTGTILFMGTVLSVQNQ
jgi:RNA polymerase sigma factor (sigma-70 family)